LLAAALAIVNAGLVASTVRRQQVRKTSGRIDNVRAPPNCVRKVTYARVVC